MTSKITMTETTELHDNGTVTYWSVYLQQWIHRARTVPDRELAAMRATEVDTIRAHLATAIVVGCRCAAALGLDTACEWEGPRADTRLIAWMPEYLRSSHEAAGHDALTPESGALRDRMEWECANRVLEALPEWSEKVA